MNKFLKYTAVALLGLSISACTADEFPTFDGESALNFNTTDSGTKTVESGQVSSEAIIEYGTLKPVSGTHQVKLVYDAAASTAVPGVDFELIDGGIDEITSGQAMGQFKVKILESGATPVPKVAVFHLSSATLPLASFNQDFALTMSLKCSISFLVGSGTFDYTGSWNNPGPPQYLIIQGTAPNTLEVVDWLDTGNNWILKYDGNGVINFDTQDTGVQYSNGSNFIIKESEVGAVSTYDTCARTLNLTIRIRAGSANFGEYNEVFTGV